jgi:hypothetical protein
MKGRHEFKARPLEGGRAPDIKRSVTYFSAFSAGAAAGSTSSCCASGSKNSPAAAIASAAASWSY